MKPGVVNQGLGKETFIAEGCFIVEVWNRAEDPALSVARARVAAGTETVWHFLDVDERYLIIEGTGIMELAGSPVSRVGPGDVIAVPAGCAQRIRNPTDHDLIFYCLCTPRFEARVYHELEESDD